MTINQYFKQFDIPDTHIDVLGLKSYLIREIRHLSGGELQRFLIAGVCGNNADLFIFDEPTCYLDIKQRIKSIRCHKDKVTQEKLYNIG